VSRDVNGLRSALVSPTRSALRRLRLPAAGEQIRDIPRQLGRALGWVRDRRETRHRCQ